MASVETTTIRVRRSTQKRLQEEAEQRGTSVTEVLEVAADILEEQRLLESAELSWGKHGSALREEMKDWLDMPGPRLPDDDWSDALANPDD
ncbi:MAG: hypothetical protein JST31_14245 [Actinobacteria bacterium]|nr:hypothetical protein [Actinomycetota bacterium]